MQDKDWVLVNREDENLYVVCSFKTPTRKGTTGRAVWEFTDNFHSATGFGNSAEIDAAVRKHHIPVNMVRLRDYGKAFTTWTQRQPHLQ